MKHEDILEQEAIDAAVHRNWEIAIQKNKELLKLDHNGIDTFLRLGFAYLQQNKLEEAKKYYKKALRLQPQHQVARENYERIIVLEQRGSKGMSTNQNELNPTLFLEVPGKTKNVCLVNVGQKQAVAEVNIGEKVYLKPKRHRIEVRSGQNSYIGSLPDDISKRILYFMKAKSEYDAYIKEASMNRVVVFIQEKKLGKKVSHFASFPHRTKEQTYGITIQEQQEKETDNDTEQEDDQSDFEKMLNGEIPENEKEESEISIHTHEDDDDEEE